MTYEINTSANISGTPNTTNTFYVIRSKFPSIGTNGFSKDLISGTCFDSDVRHKIDDVPHYPTLCAAMQRWAKNTYRQCDYEIVKVVRTTIRGTVIPGKTTRRVVQDGEVVPVGAKWALANPFSANTKHQPFYSDASPCQGAQLEDARLFSSDVKLVQFVAGQKGSDSVRVCGSRIVRVVEEVIPGSFAPDVVTETLTVIQ